MKIELSSDYKKITMTADPGMVLVPDEDELLKSISLQMRAKNVTISVALPYWSEVPVSAKFIKDVE